MTRGAENPRPTNQENPDQVTRIGAVQPDLFPAVNEVGGRMKQSGHKVDLEPLNRENDNLGLAKRLGNRLKGFVLRGSGSDVKTAHQAILAGLGEVSEKNQSDIKTDEHRTRKKVTKVAIASAAAAVFTYGALKYMENKREGKLPPQRPLE